MAVVRGSGAAARIRRKRARVRSADKPAKPDKTSRRIEPHLALLRAPKRQPAPKPLAGELTVATYNVHRWTGLNGRSRPDPARGCFVISELQADVIALQEVLRPAQGEDPLENLADALSLHVAFAATRAHRRGVIGNAILTRWPIAGLSMLDLSYNRIEKRLAVAAQLQGEVPLDVVATHLALSGRTRHRQVQSLLEHPRLVNTPTLLLGDMNTWRRCKASRSLDEELPADRIDWPLSFPAAGPVLALDRIYARGVEILDVRAHDTPAARRASDHLPVVARVRAGVRPAEPDDSK